MGSLQYCRLGNRDGGCLALLALDSGDYFSAPRDLLNAGASVRLLSPSSRIGDKREAVTAAQIFNACPRILVAK